MKDSMETAHCAINRLVAVATNGDLRDHLEEDDSYIVKPVEGEIDFGRILSTAAMFTDPSDTWTWHELERLGFTPDIMPSDEGFDIVAVLPSRHRRVHLPTVICEIPPLPQFQSAAIH